MVKTSSSISFHSQKQAAVPKRATACFLKESNAGHCLYNLYKNVLPAVAGGFVIYTYLPIPAIPAAWSGYSCLLYRFGCPPYSASPKIIPTILQFTTLSCNSMMRRCIVQLFYAAAIQSIYFTKTNYHEKIFAASFYTMFINGHFVYCIVACPDKNL